MSQVLRIQTGPKNQHPQQILPSPARLDLTNHNSPSVPNPSTPKLSSTSQQPQQQQQTATPTVKKTSSTLLSLLPPLLRAQSLLLQMASLVTKLFDISPNRSHWITSFRGSLPNFLPSQTQTQTQTLTLTLTHTADAVSSTKEILSFFTSLQTQLFEAVAQLQEILDLQNARQKVAHDIRSMDNSILAFTKKLKEAVQVLELLVDDYSDYRQPKHLKSGNACSPANPFRLASWNASGTANRLATCATRLETSGPCSIASIGSPCWA